jgi:multicomponent K+:H+ antiporter subunit D
MVHSTLATAALFLIADLVMARRGNGSLRSTLPPLAQGGLVGALFFAGGIAMAGMPPLSGFIGKLLILDATRAAQPYVWPVILGTSLILILGFARAGTALFWNTGGEVLPHRPDRVAFAAVGALLAMTLGLAILAQPVLSYMQATAAQLLGPDAYIAANALQGAAP